MEDVNIIPIMLPDLVYKLLVALKNKFMVLKVLWLYITTKFKSNIINRHVVGT